MFYRAINLDTGETWESYEFKHVYYSALHAAKGELYADHDRFMCRVRFTSVDTAIDLYEETTGREWTVYLGEESIGYMNVSDCLVIIAMWGHGFYDIKREDNRNVFPDLY